MEIKLYNSLTNRIEVFTPIKENEISIYVCGPTVYNDPHIGNIRPAVFFDTLRRFFEKVGYKVNYVENFTDIDDKIINKAIERNISEKELSSKYINEYIKIKESINIEKAYKNPKVSEYIKEIIDFIDVLVKNGHAYVNDGDVFYDVSKDNNYGILSKINIEDLNNGSRVEINEKKKNPLDFLLWKKTEIGIKWNSPWGKGRPGWHTECCVMIDSLFHETIDIHGGGSDLKFPHHENEIAQYYSYKNKKLANYWIHIAMMDINGNKMSKSLGNVILAKDAIKEYGANLVRLMLLNASYRQKIDFNDDTIKNNKSILEKIENSLKQANLILSINDYIDKKVHLDLNEFLEYLADDMNISKAITYLLNIIKELNSLLRAKELDLEKINYNFNLILEITDVFGLMFNLVKLDSSLKELYLEYLNSKKEKDFEKSDKIRNILINKNIL